MTHVRLRSLLACALAALALLGPPPATAAPPSPAALFQAIDNGDASAVDTLLAAGVDPNAPDLLEGAATPLILAAGRGQEAIVRSLLDHGANVDSVDANGKTALMAAAGKTAIALALIARRARVDLADHDGDTALMAAARASNGDVIRALVAAGASVQIRDRFGETPLTEILIFCNSPDTPAALFLIAHDAPLDADGAGRTPLVGAAAHASVDVVQALLDRGAAINQAQGDGKTPLIAAATRLDMVRFLLSKGANPKAVDRDGDNAVLAALFWRTGDTVPILGDAGADVSLHNRDDMTPLDWAVKQRLYTAAAYLVTHGADVNRAGRDGDTPLMLAGGDHALMALLLDHGANPNVRNTYRDSAIQRCLGDPEGLRLLMRHGADLNLADGLGTPLHNARFLMKEQPQNHDYAEAARILAEAGAKDEETAH